MLDAAGARRGRPSITATTSARRREKAGVADAFDIPGFVPEYIRPLFCEGKGPFRWAALSGDPADIAATDDLALEMFADDDGAVPLDPAGARAGRVPGTAGADLLARLRRARALRPGASTTWSAAASCTAPIVIGRDHLDTGSVASPNRETEGMRDGSDAIADWPVLNALLNTSSGATWVSVHHGGGVGIGYSLHAGMVVVADGTREADEKLERVLTCDPGLGVVRHADAGYPEAIATARARGIDMPMATSGRVATMMIPERPALERRVLAALDGIDRRSGPRIPVVLGGCGTGRTSLLLRLRDLHRPQRRRSTSTSSGSRRRRSASSQSLRESSPFPAHAVRAGRRRRTRARARRSTRRWRSSTRRAAGGGAGDVPARRVPRAAHVRELPGAAHRCCAI